MCLLVGIFKENCFLTSPLCRLRGERSTFVSATLLRGERKPGTHWIGGWVRFRDGPDVYEKIKTFILIWIRTAVNPARSLVTIPNPEVLRKSNIGRKMSEPRQTSESGYEYFRSQSTRYTHNYATFAATGLVERRGVELVGTAWWNEMIGRLLLICCWLNFPLNAKFP